VALDTEKVTLKMLPATILSGKSTIEMVGAAKTWQGNTKNNNSNIINTKLV
jgi:hypothetical protein